MKLYNIFKPHIVEFADGTFAVRKRGWICLFWVYKDRNGWRYNSTSDIQWWLSDYLNHCKVKTYEAALQVIALRKPPYEDPNQVIKVYP